MDIFRINVLMEGLKNDQGRSGVVIRFVFCPGCQYLHLNLINRRGATDFMGND